MPDSRSTAVSVKITEVESVYSSPPLITMVPVGGVVSPAALTSTTSASKNTAKASSTIRARAGTEIVLLIILCQLL